MGSEMCIRDSAGTVREAARALAEALAIAHPDLVVSTMTKSARRGRVLLDWSQNTAAKTTICPYSLRGKGSHPLVAAPRRWAEIEAAADGLASLTQLGPAEVTDRLSAGAPMSVLACDVS